jgi:malate dehydrogenase
MVPITSACTINGIAATELMSQEALDAIITRTRKGGGEIVGLMGTSAYYAPASSAVSMAAAYLNDERRLLPCAARLQGEYGYEGFFMGVPCIIGAGGMEKIVEIALTDDEKAMLETSANAVKTIIDIVNAG